MTQFNMILQCALSNYPHHACPSRAYDVVKKSTGGGHSHIKRVLAPDKGPASQSMITQLAQISTQRSLEEGRECL